MSGEIPLAGGRSVDGVVRVGDTVRRPPQHATQTMRDVLVHLERVGFAGAPQWLGSDDEGRDVLAWIEGDTPAWSHTTVWPDAPLVASARLLRRYHDATAGSELACEAEVVVHGDYAPWNLIYRSGLPVAAIDFDNARPGSRSEDVGYALRTHLNLSAPEIDPREQVRRAVVYVEAYGTPFDLARLLEAEYDATQERCRRNGWRHELARLGEERRWLDRNRALLG